MNERRVELSRVACGSTLYIARVSQHPNIFATNNKFRHNLVLLCDMAETPAATTTTIEKVSSPNIAQGTWLDGFFGEKYAFMVYTVIRKSDILKAVRISRPASV